MAIGVALIPAPAGFQRDECCSYVGALRVFDLNGWLIFGAFMFALGYEDGLGRRIALLLVKAAIFGVIFFAVFLVIGVAWMLFIR